jgi:hypothetical protein
MTQPIMGRSRTFWLVLVVSLLCLLLLVLLLDPLPWLADIVSIACIRWELPRAMERWEAQDLEDYQVVVKGAIPLACLLDGHLTVRAGTLSEVRMRENPLVPDSPLTVVNPEDWDRSSCPFKDLTVEAMFARLEGNIGNLRFFGAPLRVKFDHDAGYVTEYHFGRASQGGIFGATISECCTWFEFSDLTTLPPE